MGMLNFVDVLEMSCGLKAKLSDVHNKNLRSLLAKIAFRRVLDRHGIMDLVQPDSTKPNL